MTGYSPARPGPGQDRLKTRKPIIETTGFPGFIFRASSECDPLRLDSARGVFSKGQMDVLWFKIITLYTLSIQSNAPNVGGAIGAKTQF